MLRRSANPFREARYGFTLVELLVVITIVALLMSMLLPAMNAARGTAKAVQCAANMRALALPLTSYFPDFHENYPPRAWHSYPANYTNPVFAGWPAPFGYWIDASTGEVGDGNATHTPNWMDMVYGYTASRADFQKTIQCPDWYYAKLGSIVSDIDATHFGFGCTENLMPQWDFNGTGTIPGRPILNCNKTTSVTKPNQTVWIFDRFRPDRINYIVGIGSLGLRHPGLSTKPPDSNASYWASAPQTGYTNVLFADAHVGPIRTQAEFDSRILINQ